MPDETKTTDYLIGQMSGKLDVVLGQITTISTAFNAHIQQDMVAFKEVNKDVGDIKSSLAKYAGALAVLSAAVSVIGPLIVNKFVH